MEKLIGGILLAGVIASLACIVAGLAWHWAAAGTLRVEYELPTTNVAGFLLADARTVSSLHAGPRRLISIGIGLLLATPYARVLASMVYFVATGNWKYSLFTAIVLATLTYGLAH